VDWGRGGARRDTVRDGFGAKKKQREEGVRDALVFWCHKREEALHRGGNTKSCVTPGVTGKRFLRHAA